MGNKGGGYKRFSNISLKFLRARIGGRTNWEFVCLGYNANSELEIEHVASNDDWQWIWPN